MRPYESKRQTAHIPVTIAINTAISDAIDLKGLVLVGISMPADWTAANLTFQAAGPDGTYWNLYDAAGTEVSVTAAEDRFIAINPAAWEGVNRLKVRSGTSGTPVNQAAARTINLIVKPLAG